MVEVRHLNIDDLAAVRYVLTTAVAGAAPNHYAPAEVVAREFADNFVAV